MTHSPHGCFGLCGIAYLLVLITATWQPATTPFTPSPPEEETPAFGVPPRDSLIAQGDSVAVEVIRLNASGKYERINPSAPSLGERAQRALLSEPVAGTPIDYAQLRLRFTSKDASHFHQLSLVHIGSFTNEQGGETTYQIPIGLDLVDNLGNIYKFQAVTVVRYGDPVAPKTPELVPPSLSDFTLKPEEFVEVEARFSPSIVRKADSVTLTIQPRVGVAKAPITIRLPIPKEPPTLEKATRIDSPCVPSDEVHRIRLAAIKAVPRLATCASMDVVPLLDAGQMKAAIIFGKNANGCVVMAYRFSVPDEKLTDLVGG